MPKHKKAQRNTRLQNYCTVPHASLTGLTGSSPPVHRNNTGVGGSVLACSSARAASSMVATCEPSSAAPAETIQETRESWHRWESWKNAVLIETRRQFVMPKHMLEARFKTIWGMVRAIQELGARLTHPFVQKHSCPITSEKYSLFVMMTFLLTSATPHTSLPHPVSRWRCHSVKQ